MQINISHRKDTKENAAKGLKVFYSLFFFFFFNFFSRFRKDDIYNLKEVLQIPAQITCKNGSKVPGLEGLCVLLARFAYPCRYGDLIKMLGRSVPQLCLVTSFMIDFVCDNFAHLLSTFRSTVGCPQSKPRLCCCSGGEKGDSSSELLGLRGWNSRELYVAPREKHQRVVLQWPQNASTRSK
ncbi:hypothetical protein HOLleu_42879 [Holothuria leucospilota]|uniref:Uncharacterized protein n=1 Tax=Holothuria leucospilota TaxID=206669 RepID=A0A9Q0YCI7_HOLLE|nr:hypothetical protein HOLleu_42879 [Holothuria leucospilota]